MLLYHRIRKSYPGPRRHKNLLYIPQFPLLSVPLLERLTWKLFEHIFLVCIYPTSRQELSRLLLTLITLSDTPIATLYLYIPSRSSLLLRETFIYFMCIARCYIIHNFKMTCIMGRNVRHHLALPR